MNNPDKLYIPSPYRREGWMKRHSEKDVEYVRKDAFIEKAIEWLKGEGRLFKYMAFDNTSEGREIYMTGDLYEDFRKAMKED